MRGATVSDSLLRPCIFGKYDDNIGEPHDLFLGPYKVDRLHILQETVLDQVLGTRHKSKDLNKCIKDVALTKGKPCYEIVEADGFPAFPEDDEFVNIMVRDGCFVLELLNIMMKEKHPLNYLRNNFRAYKDSINLSQLRKLLLDLLMIKNQLPMVIMIELHKLLEYDTPLDRLLDNFLHLQSFAAYKVGLQTADACHLLDFARMKMLPGMMTKNQRNMASSDTEGTDETDDKSNLGSSLQFPSWTSAMMRWGSELDLEAGGCHFGGMSLWYSATDLHDKGVKIRPSTDGRVEWKPWVPPFSFLPALNLPRLLINKDSALIFNNMVALEQRLAKDCENQYNSLVFMPVSPYLRLLRDLIRTTEDVRALSSRGVLINDLESYEEVVEFFKSSLKVSVALEMDALSETRRMINQHCESRAASLLADLIHTYFSSPWSAISCVYAFVLLLLTVAQVVYSVVPYYWPHH